MRGVFNFINDRDSHIRGGNSAAVFRVEHRFIQADAIRARALRRADGTEFDRGTEEYLIKGTRSA